MKYIGENAITKLISLIKGDLNKKLDKNQGTANSGKILGVNVSGEVALTDTEVATLVDVPNGLLKGDGTTISVAVPGTDYAVPSTEPVVTPHIGANGNWFIGDTDTGVAAKGAKGDPGDAGKSAYASAQDGGYTGTEAQFNESLGALINIESVDALPGSPDANTLYLIREV